MKQKIEYFLNAVFYINWKWLVKRYIYSIKAISFIIIKISSFLTTKKYHEKVIDRQRKNILEMEEYLNRVPNDLINIQAKLSWILTFILYWFSLYIPILLTGFKYFYIKQSSDQAVIIFLIILLALSVIIFICYKNVIENNYLKYFEKFSKKDQTWHKKWRKIKIIFFIAPLLLIPLAFGYLMLIGVLKF
ncbi:MAG: hypothetical protein K1V80_03600 [Muribaculaceae bacterium]